MDWGFASKVYYYVVVYNRTETKKFGNRKFYAMMKI